eukprot:Rmarinus@m.8378
MQLVQTEGTNYRDTLRVVASIDGEADFRDFVASTGLDNLSVWGRKGQPKHPSIPKVHDLCGVVKMGVLDRQGSILARWKRQQFVLTKAGFLHYFDFDSQNPAMAGHHHPLASYFLPNGTLEYLAPRYPRNVFQLRVVLPGLIYNSEDSVIIQADNEKTAREWIAAIGSVGAKLPEGFHHKPTPAEPDAGVSTVPFDSIIPSESEATSSPQGDASASVGSTSVTPQTAAQSGTSSTVPEDTSSSSRISHDDAGHTSGGTKDADADADADAD